MNAWNDTASLFGDSLEAGLASSILPTEIMLLIDSGHSHTTITPLIYGRPIQSAIRRLSIGGKHLSNYLADLISLRHFSLIDEPHIISQIKADTCFVSSDFSTDLASTWQQQQSAKSTAHRDQHSAIVVDYVLPDYENLHRGYMRPHDSSHAAKMARLGVATTTGNKNNKSGSTSSIEQSAQTTAKEEVFPLGNERFVVPELLFNPSDIGMPESGIPETVMQCLESGGAGGGASSASLPRVLWQGFLGNVVVVGGCSLIPGFVERVEEGIRRLAPEEMVVRVRKGGDE